MPSPNAFNATEWLAQNARGGTQISAAAWDAVASFTMMWNFFESALCNNRASVPALARACSSVCVHLPTGTVQALDACLSFWTLRYRTPDGTSVRF